MILFLISEYWNSPDLDFQILPTLQERWLIKFQSRMEANSLEGQNRALMKVGLFLLIRVVCAQEYTLQVKITQGANEELFEDLSTLPSDRFFQLTASLEYDPILAKHIFKVRVDGLVVLSSDKLEPAVRNHVIIKGGSANAKLRNIVVTNL